MKKKIFTLIMAAFAAAGAWAQISSLPFTADFEAGIAPFNAGAVVDATDVGKVLLVHNTTATAAFNVNDTEAYEIADNEEVTVAFKAMHGWEGNATTTNIQLLNSDGIVLVGYTYTYNACNVTNVVIGGQTPASFEAFMGQANFNNNKSANGYNHSQHYVLTENYTPVVTMKVHGQGAVSFNFKYMAAKSVNIDKTYSANLEGVKMDLAKIVITNNCNNEQRAFCMDDLSVSKEEKMLYKYAINYYDENNALIKTAEGAAEDGTIVAISNAPVWVDGVKYYILDDNSDQNPVSTEGNTEISVFCKRADTFAYTVTAVTGETTLCTLAKGSYFEGETVGYPYPFYLDFNGTLVKKDANDKVFNGTFLLDEDNKEISVEYANTEISNVICLVEAETLPQLNDVTTGNVSNRCSNRAGAWASEDTKIVKLAPGTYTLIAAGYGGNLMFKAGGEEVLNMETQGYQREATSEPFTLTDETDLTFVGGSGENGALDYIVLQSEDGSIVSEVTRWDFTQWSAETVANLKADAAVSSTIGWSDVEKKAEAEAGNPAPEATADKCFWLTDPEGGELKANGVAIAELRGLTFGSKYAGNRSLAIAVDYPSTTLGTYNGPKYLWLGGGGKNMPCFVIHNVKGGSEIKMGVESHKPADARGVRLYVKTDEVDANGDPAITGEPLKDIEGNDVALPNTYTEQVWYLPENADIIVYNTSGCHLYFIECVQTSGPTTAINTVKGEKKMQADAIFTLNGQRVEKPGKGLYIVGGKKVIFKK